MLITKIKVKNLRIHTDAEFSFTNGINGIVGRNGAGKSSIIVAVGIGLFNAYPNLSDFVSYGNETAQIIIDFNYKNKDYLLVREFGKSSTCQLVTPDVGQLNQVKEVYPYLSNLFGVDLKTYFLNVLRIKSSSITYPFTVESSRRKVIFDDILGISEYNVIWEALREPQKLLEVSINELDSKIQFESGKLSHLEESKKYLEDYLGLLPILEDGQLEYEKYQTLIKERLELQKSIKLTNRDIDTFTLNLLDLSTKKDKLISGICYICGQAVDRTNYNKLVQPIEDNINKYTASREAAIDKRGHISNRLDELKNIPDLVDYSTEIIKTKERIKLGQDSIAKVDLLEKNRLESLLEERKLKLDTLTKIRAGFKKLPQLLSEVNTKKISYFSTEILSVLMDRNVLVNLNSQYDLSFEFDGNVLGFEQLSDGEMIMAALAIRLAMIRLFSDFGIALLDEPGVSLDDVSRELLVAKLKEIGFNQLFVISHSDEFESYMDNVIKL